MAPRYTMEQRAVLRDARQKRRMLRSIFKWITLQPGGNAHDRRKVRRAGQWHEFQNRTEGVPFAGASADTSEGAV